MADLKSEIEEFKSAYFWIAVFSEFIATLGFVLLVTAVVVNNPPITSAAVIGIAFGVGLAISVLVQIFGPISGAHINPAVTVGVFINGGCGILRAVFYTLAQFIGGIAGAGVTYGLTPEGRRGGLGSLALPKDVTLAQGFFWELILTMLLVFTVLGSTSSDHKRKDFGYGNALAIGISVTVAHLIGVPFTGSGINPARAFGPAVAVDNFPSDHWVYFLGPYLGAILAALMYRFIFSLEKKDSNAQTCELKKSNIPDV